MDKKSKVLLALLLATLGGLSLSGCSSSEVSDNAEVTADELPVVDAQTDELPNSLDQPADGQLAEAPTADGLAPEASVDMPATSPDALAEAPTDLPANSPSFEAPPSMNEQAAAPAPVEPAAPVASAPSEPTGSGAALYEVKAGDTLMKIAFMVYGDVYQWRKVLDANSDRISDPARLVKGTQLRVDNAANETYYDGYEKYLIKSGDTLGYIANDVYGTQTKWKDLWKMNDGLVKDPNRIYAGFFLRYTAGSAPLASESGSEPVRNPSSFQEAKIPADGTTSAQ